jgi:hypothetical protein
MRIAALVLLCAILFAADDDWPGFRGPHNTGVARGDVPLEFSLTKNLVWKTHIPGRGHASPVIWGDKIFLTTAIPTGEGDEYAPHLRKEHRFVVMFLNRNTGKVLWENTAKTAIPPDGHQVPYGSYASNIPVTDGKRPATGKVIWECAGLGLNSIPAPVSANGVVYVMTGFQGPNMMAIRIDRQGDLTGTDAVAWSTNRGTPHNPSPVLLDDILYFVSDTAMLSAFKASTSEAYYRQTRLPGAYSLKSSPVAVNGKLYIATEQGDVVVVKMGACGLPERGRSRVSLPCSASRTAAMAFVFRATTGFRVRPPQQRPNALQGRHLDQPGPGDTGVLWRCRAMSQQQVDLQACLSS